MNTSGRKLGFFRANGRAVQSEMVYLNLTPMIDMLTIILVFLIKVYSTDPAFLTPTQKIELSTTTSESAAAKCAPMRRANNMSG